MTPGDRLDLAVGPFAEGDVLRFETLPYERGSLSAPERTSFGTLRVGRSAPSQALIPEKLREIKPLGSGPVAPTRQVRLGFRPNPEHGMDFTINDELHHRADPVRVGELQVWDVINVSPLDHPFHRVRIAWSAEDRPGEWMYHCHILEHHAGGMMAHFEVVP
jgi:hypothetical protein